MKYLLTLLTSLIVFGSSYAKDINFKRLTTDEGLSHISVMSVYQDSVGYIWAGAREGLSKYDGKSVTTYHAQLNNENSLLSDHIFRITGNKANIIYVWTAQGVCQFDTKKERFTTLWDNSHISAISYCDRLYVAVRNQLYGYNADKGEFELIYALKAEQGDDNNITAIHANRNQEIYIGTLKSGVYLLNKKSGNIKKIVATISMTNAIYEDSQGKIWVATTEEGLFSFADGKVTNYRHSASNPNTISSDVVRSCCEDKSGNMWIGTFDGLNKLNKNTADVERYTAQIDNPDGLPHSSIWSIICDHQGTIWFGMYYGGIMYFNPEYECYNWLRKSPIESKGLSLPITGEIYEDAKGRLWICTEGGGLNIYDRKADRFKWYIADNSPNAISHNNVKSLCYDPKRDVMWMATHLGGLNSLDMRSGKFRHYKHIVGDATSLPSDALKAVLIYEDKLIISSDKGVSMFDPLTGKSENLEIKSGKQLSGVDAFSMKMDNSGRLWVAILGEGVYRYDMKSKRVDNYRKSKNKKNSLSSDNINVIYMAQNGDIYLTTSGYGIDVYNHASDDFTNLNVRNNGLLSDYVYNICQIDPHTLIFSTNEGISIYDTQLNRFTNYASKSGYPFYPINESSLFMASDSTIFVGGTKGLVSFKKGTIDFTSKKFSIVRTKLYVNGKGVAVDDETKILQQSFDRTDKIALKSRYSSLTIEFSTTNYISVNESEFEYKLEGFSDWSTVHDQNSITYTNLAPGLYRLIIRCKNDNGLGITPSVLEIKVMPPFYRTNVAYLLYIMVISWLLYYFISSYNQRVQLRASVKYNLKRVEDVESMNQSKLRFFTNIAHEIRTPLTLIIAQLESLLNLQQLTPQLYKRFITIYNSSNQLKELITELLDFRKHEQGYLKIKVSKQNIVEFLSANHLLFVEYAKLRDINFTFTKQQDIIDIWYDSGQMQKVINNILSNAFKYTGSGDEIMMNVFTTAKDVVIEVSDTGEGIPNEDIERIFDRFYQVDTQHHGTGIGLALSKGIIELHHGTISAVSEVKKLTIFTITLPLGKSHFTPDQIADSYFTDNETEHLHYEVYNNSAEADTPQPTPTMPTTYIEENKTEKNLPKILLVEDNPALLSMLKDIFSPHYHILTATNGLQASEIATMQPPDIILSDVVMPIMTGIELCRQIKSNTDTCHIPVVLLTARASVDNNIEGLDIGADDYITKPFNVNILLSRCNNLIAGRRILQQKYSQQPLSSPLELATNRIDKAIIDKAVRLVEENMDNTEFSVAHLAREMGMSRSKLFTKLKGIADQTPNDFIVTIRLKRAAYMLLNNPELSISEISSIVGFTTPRYFSKCFKDAYQTTPIAYKKNNITP